VSTADEVVRFEQDIKPLFRPVDHESMAWAFDLSSYDDVKDHATAILERLRDGSMPWRRRVARGAGGAIRAVDRDRHARMTV
jgi:hypothetical protein